MISSWCDKEISKNRFTEEEKKGLKFSFSSELSSLSDVDFVVEAATENFSVSFVQSSQHVYV